MSTVVTETVAPLVKYSVTDAQIARLRADFTGLSVDTPEGYEAVRIAIGTLRDLRGAIEKRRVELKADALAFGRAVDAEAKRITAALDYLERPLKDQKQAVDAERERVKQEAINAKRRQLEEELRAAQAVEDARLRAVREADEARLAEERAKLEAERRELDAARQKQEAADAERRRKEQAERAAEDARLRVEREAIEAERRAVQQERERAERAEFERKARIKAEEEAAAKVERDRITALEHAVQLAALQPDIEKVRVYVAAVRAITPPKVKAKRVAALLTESTAALGRIATELEHKVAQF